MRELARHMLGHFCLECRPCAPYLEMLAAQAAAGATPNSQKMQLWFVACLQDRRVCLQPVSE
jgi:hypothetical protein